MEFLIKLLFTFLITHILLILYYFKFGKSNLDIPNERSSHNQARIRGAGICFVCSTIIFSISDQYFLPLYAIPIAIIGFVDDNRSISNSARFIVQIVSSLFVIGILNSSISNISIILFLILVFTSIVNFTNFMDGIDGIVAGSLAIVFGYIAISNSPELSYLFISLVAFLFWNWQPAKVFMGDSGSTYLGAILGMLVINSNTINDAISILLLASPILFDALFTLIARFFYGQNIFSAHSKHLYQRLFQAGWSHRRISSVYIGATSILCIVDKFLGYYPLIFFSCILIIFGLFLNTLVAKPFTS